MKNALNILIAVSLLAVALSFILVYANTHPPRYPLNIPPSEYGRPFERVTFVTDDGVPLAGWLLAPDAPGKEAPAVVICHGLGANKSDFTDLAAQLARRGYWVLSFDFRAHGESGGGRSSLGYREQLDVKAAHAFLASRSGVDRKRIGIFGFSLGGATAILAAAKSGAFAAVVADSAFTSLRDQARDAITGFYHLPAFPFVTLAVLGYQAYFQTGVKDIAPEAAIGGLSPAPVLIIAGEGDEMIPAENGKRLFAAAKEPKELWIIPVAGHGGTTAAAGSEYEKRIGAFFDRHLKAR